MNQNSKDMIHNLFVPCQGCIDMTLWLCYHLAMNAVLVDGFERFGSWLDSYNRLLDRIGGMEKLYYATDQPNVSSNIFKLYGIEPFFILVHDEGEVKAVFPFQVQNDWPLGLWKTIRFIGDIGVHMGNAYPCILSDKYCPEEIDVAVDFLKTTLASKWDTMDFGRFRRNDRNMQYFISKFRDHIIVPSGEEFYYFEASAGLDKVLGSKNRCDIRRCRRRMEEAYGPVETVVKGDISDGDIEEIARIHSLRQSGKEDGDAFFSDETIGEIARGMMRQGRDKNCLRYYSLRAGNRVIAINAMFHTVPVSYGFLTAFDPEYGQYSPSRILLYESFLREMEEFGIERIEMSWGTNRMKQDFSSGFHILDNVEIVSDQWKSQAVHRFSHFLEDSIRIGKNLLRPTKRLIVRCLRRARAQSRQA